MAAESKTSSSQTLQEWFNQELLERSVSENDLNYEMFRNYTERQAEDLGKEWFESAIHRGKLQNVWKELQNSTMRLPDGSGSGQPAQTNKQTTNKSNHQRTVKEDFENSFSSYRRDIRTPQQNTSWSAWLWAPQQHLSNGLDGHLLSSSLTPVSHSQHAELHCLLSQSSREQNPLVDGRENILRRRHNSSSSQ
mmetsp:Transcript_24486/g.28830  ORF Transcript_24486/g.28830 Transcript_24486/m.28830 type:complete len:193 (+) Transcript_24486:52-630(+)